MQFYFFPYEFVDINQNINTGKNKVVRNEIFHCVQTSDVSEECSSELTLHNLNVIWSSVP